MNYDKVNGYGVMFRFVTPILVTISIFLMGLLTQKQSRLEDKFDSHLHYHTLLEVRLEGRLSSIETKVDNVDRRVGIIEKSVIGIK